MNLVTFLSWFVRCFLMIFWLFDILDVGFVELFDVKLQLNTAFWALVFIGIELNELIIMAKFEYNSGDKKGKKEDKNDEDFDKFII